MRNDLTKFLLCEFTKIWYFRENFQASYNDTSLNHIFNKDTRISVEPLNQFLPLFWDDWKPIILMVLMKNKIPLNPAEWKVVIWHR